MDDTEQYIHALSKDTDILEDLTYLGIVVKNRERSVHEPFQQIGSVHDVIRLAQYEYTALSVPMQRIRI